MELQGGRLVTHFYRREADKSGYIQTNFVTRERNSEKRYWGLSEEEILPEIINADMETGSLEQLVLSEPIQSEETVWVGPDEKVYISDAENPLHEKSRLIYETKQQNAYDLIEGTVMSKLKEEKIDAEDPLMNHFCTTDNWKILVSILAKLIHNGTITEDKFMSIGYVFVKLEPLYKREFRKFLNSHQMSFSNGKLEFTLGLSNCEWEIMITKADAEEYFTQFEEDFTRPRII